MTCCLPCWKTPKRMPYCYIGSSLALLHSSDSSVTIFKPDNIVFPKVTTRLNFNQFQR